jgi:hypothetical protein
MWGPSRPLAHFRKERRKGMRISIRRFTHDQIISQQVSKGFELLGQQGSDKLVVRLGGIYALEGVMNTSEP